MILKKNKSRYSRACVLSHSALSLDSQRAFLTGLSLDSLGALLTGTLTFPANSSSHEVLSHWTLGTFSLRGLTVLSLSLSLQCALSLCALGVLSRCISLTGLVIALAVLSLCALWCALSLCAHWTLTLDSHWTLSVCSLSALSLCSLDSHWTLSLVSLCFVSLDSRG
jgi:hypothetical protein